MQKQLVLLSLFLIYSSIYPLKLKGPETYHIQADAHIKNAASYKKEFRDLLRSFCSLCPYPGRHKSTQGFVRVLNNLYQAFNAGEGPYKVTLYAPVIQISLTGTRYNCFVSEVKTRSLGEVYFRQLVHRLNQSEKGQRLLQQIREHIEIEFADVACCQYPSHEELNRDVLALSDYFYHNPEQAHQIKQEYAPELSLQDCRLDESTLRWYLIMLRIAFNKVNYSWINSLAKVIAAKWSKNADYKKRINKPVIGWIPNACITGSK